MGEINRLEAARFVCSEYQREPEITVTALLQLSSSGLTDRRAHSLLQCPHLKNEYPIVQSSG